MRRIVRTRWVTAGVVASALAAALTVTALRGTAGGKAEEPMGHSHGGAGGAGGHADEMGPMPGMNGAPAQPPATAPTGGDGHGHSHH